MASSHASHYNVILFFEAETNGARNSHLSDITPLVAISHAGSTKQSGNKIVEILKSIVYGGLTESVTSLGIVISAASAHASTCKPLPY